MRELKDCAQWKITQPPSLKEVTSELGRTIAQEILSPNQAALFTKTSTATTDIPLQHATDGQARCLTLAARSGAAQETAALVFAK
jgi:hypothetical protein